MNPITVRSYHQTHFQSYTIITLGTLHENHRHTQRYWQWYNDHHQQFFGWMGEKKTALTLLDNPYQNLQKGAVLKDNIARIGPCWSLLMTLDTLNPYFLLVELYVFVFSTYPYVRSGVLLHLQTFPTLGL